MDGWELVEGLCQGDPMSPVIILTGQIELGDNETLRRPGLVALLDRRSGPCRSRGCPLAGAIPVPLNRILANRAPPLG